MCQVWGHSGVEDGEEDEDGVQTGLQMLAVGVTAQTDSSTSKLHN